ncbi:MAG TPA: hypothetical protein VN736_16245 [Candidatus Limnocylindrales bacterium]|nr:hypothetical protein [Candidatus Limnocylindrales bacterium]
MRFLTAALVVTLAAATVQASGLQRALSEPDLNKRSKIALENALTAYDAARKAYDSGNLDTMATDVQEIIDSVNLAKISLDQTGKDPRKSPKWFKNAEMMTRDLSRRLDAFQQDMSFADRPLLDKVKERVLQVHDDLLMGLMEGKRK